jgi:hypothetical protein
MRAFVSNQHFLSFADGSHRFRISLIATDLVSFAFRITHSSCPSRTIISTDTLEEAIEYIEGKIYGVNS